MKKYQAALMAGGSAFVLMLAHTSLATAQTTDAAAPDTSGQVQTVIVTARKRSEDLLKVPVAVSALTGNDLATRDIESLADVANFTPGMADDQSIGGTGRSDRSFQDIIIRGMVPSDTNHSTTSIFINGAPVGAPDFIQNLSDVERVEVLKGPQSAYFGRETFAGAVNVVAKSAGNNFGGEVSADVGGRRTENFSGVINVPIIDNKLAVRAGYDYDSHDGSYKNANNPGQTLGDQTTKTIHLAITARPIDNLTIKAFGMVFQDHDGPAATGLLIASGAPAGFNQGNCQLPTGPGTATTTWFCGKLPKLLSASPAVDTTVYPNGTAFSSGFSNLGAETGFLASPGGMFGNGDDWVHRYGLKRNAYHADLNVQYDVPSLGLSLTYIGAYNHDNYSEVADFDLEDYQPDGQYPGAHGYGFAYEQSSHDTSHEVRIATDQTKPYRGLIGVSYVDSYTVNFLGGAFTPNSLAIGANPTESETTGVFFAVAYDILPQLTLSFDGRYQQDKETLSTYATQATIISGTSTAFLPRVTLQYKINPDMMTYFTYSEGVNPGAFNASASTLPAASLTELASKGLEGGTIVKPEDITNYELGFKGRFLGGRATLSADIYYDKWTNQLVSDQYLFAQNDPANPYNIPSYSGYNPNSSPFSYGFTDNSAESTAKGIEVEANFIVVEHVSVNLAGAINDTQYDKFLCVGGTVCSPYTNFNAKGKYLPNSPEDSFSGGVQYSNKAPIFGDADWYARADYVYRDGVYIQASNTAKTPDINLVNIRAGLNLGGHISVEGYIDNLFNDKAYTAAFQGYDAHGGPYGFATTAVSVGLPTLITGGIKLKYKY